MATIDELIAAADRAASSSAGPDKTTTTGRYSWNQFKEGVASAAGNFSDAPARVYQLGKAAIGMSELPNILARLTGRPTSDFRPDVNLDAANASTNVLRRAGDVEQLQPADDLQRYLGMASAGAGGALIGGPVSLGKATGVNALRPLATSLAKTAGVGGVAGLGAAGGGDTANALGAPRALGEVIGGLGAGIGAASSGGMVGMLTRAPRILNEMEERARGLPVSEGAQRAASGIVDARVKAAVAGTPHAAQNIDEGLALRARIPGFQPSVAEMAQAPGALDLQRNFARSSPQALNEEVARIQASENALRSHLAANAPASGAPSSVRTQVNQALAGEENAITRSGQSVANQLPTADLVGIGDKLSKIAQAEKTAARPAINAAYERAYALAPESAVPVGGVMKSIEEALGVPLAQIKPEFAPRTFAAIQRFMGQQEAPTGMQAEMNALAGGAKQPKTTMTLAEAADLRQAMNADASMAVRATDPLAASRLHNIGQIKGSIDEAIAGSPISQQAKDAYAAANAKYATEYAPRFKEGPNALVFKEGANNEPRILADRFIAEYFKPDQMGGGTRAQNFAQLFGKNGEARDAVREGILDRFRSQVVNPETGLLDAGKAAAFQRQYGRTLDSFKAKGVNAVDDIRQFTQSAVQQEAARQSMGKLATALRFDHVDDLTNAALGSRKVMGNVLERLTPQTRDTFVRSLMEKASGARSGADIATFLDKHGDTLAMALEPKHIASLRDVSKGLQMIEQSPITSIAHAAGSDPLKASTGVSMATVWSQWRATTGGRQGAATMGFNLAAPVFTKLHQTQFNEVMQTALHDPKTAEALSRFLKSNTQAEAQGWATRLVDGVKNAGKVAWQSKGPILELLAGTRNYPANAQRSAGAIGGAAGKEQEE